MVYRRKVALQRDRSDGPDPQRPVELEGGVSRIDTMFDTRLDTIFDTRYDEIFDTLFNGHRT